MSMFGVPVPPDWYVDPVERGVGGKPPEFPTRTTLSLVETDGATCIQRETGPAAGQAIRSARLHHVLHEPSPAFLPESNN